MKYRGRRREKACFLLAIGGSHRAHESPRPEVHTETNSSGTANDLRKSGGEKVFKATTGNNTGMALELYTYTDTYTRDLE